MTMEIELAPLPGEQFSPEETIEEIVRRTRSLYSLPAVAAEVIQLTGNPKVDARALKECIEKDPALTAKILRVVNSSLFGLSREVSDLNQALALLGTKPLKLLVLGFSLPEELFTEVAREQLAWFWKTTLVRAVTARELSERLWNQPGDDAFLAGLLQDIGVLVLLDQLREPYVQFLTQVIEERSSLDTLEIQSLGFDHRTLSAALLRSWNMPEQFVEAIAAKRDPEFRLQKNSPTTELAQILHLAGLLAELVGQNRLQVLPELLELGKKYCGFDKEQLRLILPELQEKVKQLADVLSLDLPQGIDYSQIVVEAHAQMSQLCEGVAERLSRRPSPQEQEFERTLADADELRTAVGRFLHASKEKACDSGPKQASEKSSEPGLSQPCRTGGVLTPSIDSQQEQTFLNKLIWAAGNCRSRRCPLSVMLVEARGDDPENPQQQKLIGQVVEATCRAVDCDQAHVELIAPHRWSLVLPDCERQQAVRYCNELFRQVHESLDRIGEGEDSLRCVVSAGIASVTLPPKNFHPPDLVTSAERCLAAARSSEASVVKSLEIF